MSAHRFRLAHGLRELVDMFDGAAEASRAVRNGRRPSRAALKKLGEVVKSGATTKPAGEGEQKKGGGE